MRDSVTFDIYSFWGKLLYNNINAVECMNVTGLSFDALCKSIQSGNAVNGIIVTFSDTYLRQLAIDILIKDHGRFKMKQIADILGITEGNVNFTIRRSLKKMKRSFKLENS